MNQSNLPFRPFHSLKLGGGNSMKWPLLVLSFVLLATFALAQSAPTVQAQTQPVGVQATVISNSRVQITWTNPFDGTIYFTQWKTSTSTNWNITNITGTTSGIEVVDGLQAGTPYDFRIHGCADSAQTICSIWVTAATNLYTAAGVPWAAPVNLRVTSTATGHEDPLAWDAPAHDGGSAITRYEYQRRVIGQSAWETEVSTGSTATSVTVNKLDEFTSYDYQVRAVNSVGHGPWSDPLTVAGRPTWKSGPAGLPRVTDISSTSVTLDWTGNLASEGGKAITRWRYRWKPSSDDNWMESGDIPAGTTTTTVGGLTRGTVYHFDVIAYNEDRQSYASADATATTLAFAATISRTDPSPLTERTLHGARLTVDLVGTEYIPWIGPSWQDWFSLSPPTAGLSIASVRPAGDTRAIVTLAFNGNITSDLELSVEVDGWANLEHHTLTTNPVTVTQAPRPAEVTGVTATGGPGSIEVTWNADPNADGYGVRWRLTGDVGFLGPLEVDGRSTTRATIPSLLGETSYEVFVYATSNFAGPGPLSFHDTAITLPYGAIVSATDPSPLTENNLGGARLTVRLLRNVWFADGPLHASYFSVSGVPGVSVAGVERLSDTDAAVTIAYDATDPATDFDEDATLLIGIDGCAFYRCPTHTTAITTVRAVVEPPPAQVPNVRVTPGPRYISVRWDPVPGANIDPDAGGYIVQWSPPHACGFNGWSRYEIRRSTITRYSIGALCPGTEYTVRVSAIRERAPNGPASAEHRATTLEFGYRLAGTEPAQLTGSNLHGAAVLIDLQGAQWTHAARERVKLSGIDTRLWVERVERVSASRLRVVLGNLGPRPLDGGELTVRVYADLHTWNQDVEVTVPVQAVQAAGGLRVVEVTENSITVAWDRVEGNDVWYQVRWQHTGSTGGWLSRWTRLTSHTLRGSRDYITPNTAYTVQVRSDDHGGAGLSKWSTVQMTTTPAATSPTLSVDPPRVAEGDGGTTTPMVFSFTLSKSSEETVKAEFVIESRGSTATLDDDYTVEQQSGLLTFAPGDTVKTLTVTVNGDDAGEPDETVIVDVGWLKNAFFGSGFEAVVSGSPHWRSVTGAIVNDEILGASVSATAPSPLTERTLHGARLTVDLEETRYVSSLSPGQFSLALRAPSLGVNVQPQTVGLSVASVQRESNTRAVLTLGFTGDFRNDVELSVEVASAATTAGATLVTDPVTVTPAPALAQVQNVRLTPGPGSLDVAWDADPNADGYSVTWWETGNIATLQERPIPGGSTTSTTLSDLKGETSYNVVVVSTSDFTGDGATSETATATTLATTSPARRASVKVTAADPVAVDEGASATYTMVLDGEPTANVVIAMSSDNADVTAEPASLTFTTGNWDTAQTVTVRAAHDGDAADDKATVSHAVSGADEYAGIVVDSVNFSVTDDDTAGVTVSETSLSINEGGTATYTVVLDTQPIADVEIYPFAHSGVTAEPDILTFTPDNWDKPQTVTVSAAQDENTKNEEVTIVHGISAAAESAYADADVTIASVTVSVTDDDTDAQPVQPEPENNAPVAEAGPDQSVDAGAAVSLDGSVSSDPDRDDLTYVWTQTSGPSVTLSGASSAAPRFTAPNEDATLVFSLTVNDGTVDSAADTVAITVVVPDPQREALEAFYNATGGSSWTNSANWLTDQPLGEWHGVTVNGQGQVTHLALRNNNLSGPLPAALGDLEALQVLSLDRNSISGSLPTQLGNLSNLTRLAMNRNQLTGSIPTELGNLSNLSIIGLARNQLSGTLPSSLGNLTGLTKLSLHDNTDLTGALPGGFVNFANLQRLAIARTGLCAPDTSAFTDWLDTVPDKPDGVQTCE